jgi:hypothetical protein
MVCITKNEEEFTMIILGNRAFKPIKAFDNEEELWVYLQAQANLKPKEGGSTSKWRFAYYPHHMLKDYREMMEWESFYTIASQSVNQQQNIVVVEQGNAQNPQCFLVTPELDTARLKRDWCKAYAATHGLQIVMG